MIQILIAFARGFTAPPAQDLVETLEIRAYCSVGLLACAVMERAVAVRLAEA